MRVDRIPIRRVVADELRRRVVLGAVRPGQRLIETDLAREFGVSQTPVREALFGLEVDGFLTSRPGCGFAVAELSIEEVKETFPILGSLEAMALRSAGIPDIEQMQELHRINDRMRSEATTECLDLDGQWHDCLLSHCTNQRLKTMLAGLKRAVYRYDYAYMRQESSRSSSAACHDSILAELENRQLAKAARLLEKNWTDGIPAMVSWLEQRRSEGSDDSGS